MIRWLIRVASPVRVMDAVEANIDLIVATHLLGESKYEPMLCIVAAIAETSLELEGFVQREVLVNFCIRCHAKLEGTAPSFRHDQHIGVHPMELALTRMTVIMMSAIKSTLPRTEADLLEVLLLMHEDMVGSSDDSRRTEFDAVVPEFRRLYAQCEYCVAS